MSETRPILIPQRLNGALEMARSALNSIRDARNEMAEAEQDLNLALAKAEALLAVWGEVKP